MWSKFIWPWRYALVRVKLLDDGCYDYEVRVDAGPTRWGPWVLPISVEEVERTRPIEQWEPFERKALADQLEPMVKLWGRAKGVNV